MEDYARDLIDFLQGNRTIFPAEKQSQYFSFLVSAFYRRINQDIQEGIKNHFEKSKTITTAQIQKIAKLEIDKKFAELRKLTNLPGFNEDFAVRLIRKFSKVQANLQNEIFQKLPLSSDDRIKIRKMSGWLFIRDSFRLAGTSGVVVAGFGERDLYPRLQEFIVEGIIEGRLRYRKERQIRIGIDMIGSIVPFAQGNVVANFIDGVDPNLERLLDRFHDQLFANYPDVLLKLIPTVSAKTKRNALAKARLASQKILKRFRDEFEKYRRQTMVDPITATVAVLPKDELAAMAEALVNLTSIRRKFSLDAETVGGPVDVAVLSKGDGFIWIKRKHYFKPELNQHFLANYFENR
ncbi:MAG: hypothetical protein LAP85_29445 [Acidobacteriia bacterium]|nr:hypothetical protein [Terriglobia bacterium]